MESKEIYTAVALGFFDGVHLGHQSIIQETVKYEKKDVIPIVYTFKQSPKEVINKKSYFYLTTNEKKINLFLNYGIKKVYMDNFENIKNLSCREFIFKILKEKLNAKYVICGENYTFGYEAKGSSITLKNICKNYDINVDVIKLKTYNGKCISSSEIKRKIEFGNIDEAEKMLGNSLTKIIS